MLSTVLNIFNGIPIIIQQAFFFFFLVGIDQQILKFIWKCKKARIAKNIVGVLILPDIIHRLMSIMIYHYEQIYNPRTDNVAFWGSSFMGRRLPIRFFILGRLRVFFNFSTHHIKPWVLTLLFYWAKYLSMEVCFSALLIFQNSCFLSVFGFILLSNYCDCFYGKKIQPRN